MKNKFIYTFSALLLSCVIAFSGVGGTYLQARASSPGIGNVLWNEDETAWENIKKYINLYLYSQGAYLAPNLFTSFFAVDNISSFMDFMTADSKFTKQESHDALCGCGNAYTSCPAFISDGDKPTYDVSLFVDGGGGAIQDGITPTDDGGVAISDEISDLFHDYVQHEVDAHVGYVYFKTQPVSTLMPSYFYTPELYNYVKDSINNLSVENYVCSIDYQNFYSTNDGSRSCYSLYFGGIDLDNYGLLAYYPDSFYSAIQNGVYDNSSSTRLQVISNDTWEVKKFPTISNSKFTDGFIKDVYIPTEILSSSNDYYFNTTYDFYAYYLDSGYPPECLYTSDGRHVKVWLNASEFRNYNVGKQSVYVTNNWLNYGGTVNNTTVITGGEVEIYNNTNIYQTIQDDIDNYDGDLTEDVVQTIVDDAIDRIIDKMEDIQEEGSVVIPNEDTKTFYDKVLDYLDKILKQLKQIKWLNVADLVDDIIANLMEWKSEFEPVVETIMTKFPFSIPWDTMLIFGLLADEPETPRFEFPFVLERFGINEVIVIDLEQFTTLSKISRFLLTLTFLLMLTALTRKISEWFHSSN